MGCCVSRQQETYPASDIHSVQSENREYVQLNENTNLHFKKGDVMHQGVECVVLGCDLSVLNYTPVHMTYEQKAAIDSAVERQYGPRSMRNFVIKDEDVVVLEFVQGLPSQNRTPTHGSPRIKLVLLVGVNCWRLGAEFDHTQRLKQVYERVLGVVRDKRVRSVCFTDVGYELFGVPLAVGATALSEAIRDHVRVASGNVLMNANGEVPASAAEIMATSAKYRQAMRSLREIYFVFQEDDHLQVYKDIMHKTLGLHTAVRATAATITTHYDSSQLLVIDNASAQKIVWDAPPHFVRRVKEEHVLRYNSNIKEGGLDEQHLSGKHAAINYTQSEVVVDQIREKPGIVEINHDDIGLTR